METYYSEGMLLLYDYLYTFIFTLILLFKQVKFSSNRCTCPQAPDYFTLRFDLMCCPSKDDSDDENNAKENRSSPEESIFKCVATQEIRIPRATSTIHEYYPVFLNISLIQYI
jgi:hypothetical protein